MTWALPRLHGGVEIVFTLAFRVDQYQFRAGSLCLLWYSVSPWFTVLVWLERRNFWLKVLTITSALLQFCMTWIMLNHTAEMLFAFAGVRGEFYLSTF
ncbi:MAG: hypothetical protein ACUVRV_00270 [Cyanobacteriota bacterium]